MHVQAHAHALSPLLTRKRGLREIFFEKSVRDRKGDGELVTWELLVHLHQELLLFALLPSRRLSRKSLREEGGSTMVLEKK